MDQSTVDELLFQINGKVESISAKIDSLTETLLKHESRISVLEKDVLVIQKTEPHEASLKSELLRLLAKCVLVSVSALAALAGAGEILSKMMH